MQYSRCLHVSLVQCSRQPRGHRVTLRDAASSFMIIPLDQIGRFGTIDGCRRETCTMAQTTLHRVLILMWCDSMPRALLLFSSLLSTSLVESCWFTSASVSSCVSHVGVESNRIRLIRAVHMPHSSAFQLPASSSRRPVARFSCVLLLLQRGAARRGTATGRAPRPFRSVLSRQQDRTMFARLVAWLSRPLLSLGAVSLVQCGIQKPQWCSWESAVHKFRRTSPGSRPATRTGPTRTRTRPGRAFTSSPQYYLTSTSDSNSYSADEQQHSRLYHWRCLLFVLHSVCLPPVVYSCVRMCRPQCTRTSTRLRWRLLFAARRRPRSWLVVVARSGQVRIPDHIFVPVTDSEGLSATGFASCMPLIALFGFVFVLVASK